MTTSTNDDTKVVDLISLINKKLSLKETAIFCGAGVSFNSGLPLVNDLIKKILGLLEIKYEYVEKLLKSNLPFEAFIQTLIEEAGADDILDIFSKGEPNSNHNLIAQLVVQGYVRTILTTNFDTLIEKALNNVGLVEGSNYQVYSNEKDFKKVNWQNNAIRVIKIHGCISSRDEMAITLGSVARKTINQYKSKIISSFFSKLVNNNILILGYSCSDLFDISPLIESVEESRSEILFLEHSFNEIKVEEICLREFKNPFKNYVGQRFFLSTDTFTEHIWNNISTSNYEYKRFEISWEENIRKWYQDASSYSLGMKNQIAARIFYDIGDYNLAIKLWEEGLNIAQTERNQLFFYAQLGNIGMAFNAVGRFVEAEKCLEASIKSCVEIGNTQGEVSQLQALGNVYRNLRQFDKAVTVFQKAVEVASQYHPESLSSCFGNLTNVYNQIQDHDNVIATLKNGLPIAVATGNKQNEGSMLCSLGVAFFLKGNVDKAINLVLESLKLTRQIGDRQGECIALHNLSNIFMQLEKFENCLEYSNLCLTIAKETGIRQSEAGALYNIGTLFFFKGEQILAIENLKQAIKIYTEIFGKNHEHTISAINALIRAEKYPDSNKIMRMK